MCEALCATVNWGRGGIKSPLHCGRYSLKRLMGSWLACMCTHILNCKPCTHFMKHGDMARSHSLGQSWLDKDWALIQTEPIRGSPYKLVRRACFLCVAGQVTWELQVAMFPAGGPRNRERWTHRITRHNHLPSDISTHLKPRYICALGFYRDLYNLP